MTSTTVRFSRKCRVDFTKTLKHRVGEYFKENDLSRKANANMVVKTIFMLLLYFVPYFLMLFLNIQNIWFHFAMWIIMGLGMAGIGLSVMHDGNHGAYSRKQSVNKFMGGLLVILGGSPINWRIQHNVLHHSFTNVEGHDEDIDPGILMRFSPHKKRYKIHRFQHFYAWFLYGLLTISWLLIKDAKNLIKYHKEGLTKTEEKSITRLWIELIIFKSVYVSYAIVIPILFFGTSVDMTILLYLMMQFICGVLLALIFQPAHVMNDTNYPLPDEDGSIENNWFIHQLETTANFANKSRLFSWYVGGLNFQIEHHLFPSICHIHYKKIAPIVKQTAEEFGIPYHHYKTFVGALAVHAKTLRDLGKFEKVPAFN